MNDFIKHSLNLRRRLTFAQSQQWTLGDLIDALESVHGLDKCRVSFDFGNIIPTTCRSWRGSYDELALGYIEGDYEHEAPLLTDFLQHLRDCVDKQFDGYKGGTYLMTRQTPIWVDNYGNFTETGIIGIRTSTFEDVATWVYLRTDHCEY